MWIPPSLVGSIFRLQWQSLPGRSPYCDTHPRVRERRPTTYVVDEFFWLSHRADATSQLDQKRAKTCICPLQHSQKMPKRSCKAGNLLFKSLCRADQASVHHLYKRAWLLRQDPLIFRQPSGIADSETGFSSEVLSLDTPWDLHDIGSLGVVDVRPPDLGRASIIPRHSMYRIHSATLLRSQDGPDRCWAPTSCSLLTVPTWFGGRGSIAAPWPD